MSAIIVIVLILALLGILGAILKGILWLVVVAAIVFVAGAVAGWLKTRSTTT